MIDVLDLTGLVFYEVSFIPVLFSRLSKGKVNCCNWWFHRRNGTRKGNGFSLLFWSKQSFLAEKLRNYSFIIFPYPKHQLNRKKNSSCKNGVFEMAYDGRKKYDDEKFLRIFPEIKKIIFNVTFMPHFGKR